MGEVERSGLMDTQQQALTSYQRQTGREEKLSMSGGKNDTSMTNGLAVRIFGF